MITSEEIQKAKQEIEALRAAIDKVTVELVSDDSDRLRGIKRVLVDIRHDLEHLDDDFDELAAKDETVVVHVDQEFLFRIVFHFVEIGVSVRATKETVIDHMEGLLSLDCVPNEVGRCGVEGDAQLVVDVDLLVSVFDLVEDEELDSEGGAKSVAEGFTVFVSLFQLPSAGRFWLGVRADGHRGDRDDQHREGC